MKKRLKILIPAVAIIGVAVLLGFVNSRRSASACSTIQVEIKRPDGNEYVSENEIRAIMQSYCDSTAPEDGMNIRSLEQEIGRIGAVEKCNVYIDVTGAIHARITQRVPIARVFNTQGEQAYIDDKGKYMPVISGVPARVIVFSGEINERLVDMGTTVNQDSLDKISLRDELFLFARTVKRSEFWSAQCEQVYVDAKGNFIITPKVGKHQVMVGSIDHLEKKLNKLQFFYQEGLTRSGWNEYRTIDIQYKNQVVCRRADGSTAAPADTTEKE